MLILFQAELVGKLRKNGKYCIIQKCKHDSAPSTASYTVTEFGGNWTKRKFCISVYVKEIGENFVLRER